MMTFQRLHRDRKGSAGLLETLIERMASFARRFNTNPTPLAEQAWNAFATRDPAMGLWLALRDDGEVIGHAVAGINMWSGEWVGWIFQVEMDEWSSRELHESFDDDLEAWGREWNEHARASGRPHMAIRFFRGVTHVDPKVHARWSGFKPELTVMYRPTRKG